MQILKNFFFVNQCFLYVLYSLKVTFKKKRKNVCCFVEKNMIKFAIVKKYSYLCVRLESDGCQ